MILLVFIEKTLTTDGIVGLYRGFVTPYLGVMIYRGCYFAFYDTLKSILLSPDVGIALLFILGYGVTITSGFISHLINTI